MKIRFKGLYEYIHNFFTKGCSKCGGKLEMVGYEPDMDTFIYQCKECGRKSF